MDIVESLWIWLSIDGSSYILWVFKCDCGSSGTVQSDPICQLQRYNRQALVINNYASMDIFYAIE